MPHVPGQFNKPLSLPAHALSCREIEEELDANLEEGLSVEECKRRLKLYGRNELDGGLGVQPVKILVRQVANAMMLVRRSSCPDRKKFL
jgi:Na+-exporting ATPase